MMKEIYHLQCFHQVPKQEHRQHTDPSLFHANHWSHSTLFTCSDQHLIKKKPQPIPELSTPGSQGLWGLMTYSLHVIKRTANIIALLCAYDVANIYFKSSKQFLSQWSYFSFIIQTNLLQKQHSNHGINDAPSRIGMNMPGNCKHQILKAGKLVSQM